MISSYVQFICGICYGWKVWKNKNKIKTNKHKKIILGA